MTWPPLCDLYVRIRDVCRREADPPRTRNIGSDLIKSILCADLREDKIIDPAPGFWPMLGPLGPTAGPGSLGTGSSSATCTTSQPWKPIISPIRGHFVFLGPTAKKIKNINGKFEAPQGLPSKGDSDIPGSRVCSAGQPWSFTDSPKLRQGR